MKKVTLHINNQNESRTVELGDELSVGRTASATLVLNDAGLSRVNTTFFRDANEIFAVDENSTNGTFVNGERLSAEPRALKDRDEITIGTHTNIYVEIIGEQFRQASSSSAAVARETAKNSSVSPTPSADQQPSPQSIPLVLLAAGAMFVLIVVGAVAAVLLLDTGGSGTNENSSVKPANSQTARSGLLIPVRVIDPLGGEDPDDLDDLIASWEGVEETTLDATTVDAVSATTAGGANELNLNVPVEEWIKQKNLAFAGRTAPVGIDPGLKFFPELGGGSVIKQKAKLSELIKLGYKQPMDFSDLAEKRLRGDLMELPIATPWYFLDVGGSASENPFTAYSYEMGSTPIAPGSAKYKPLDDLAKSFQGQKYDLNNGRDRRQIRIRLLRMFHPSAKLILEELAKAYQQKFGRPLRVTSLTRSIDYQISLNANNPNSYKVRGAGSLPPHTSGCAFDLARKHMTADEQNFVQAKLADMENRGVLDALREGGANACFHVFIYPDGRAPKI